MAERRPRAVAEEAVDGGRCDLGQGARRDRPDALPGREGRTWSATASASTFAALPVGAASAARNTSPRPAATRWAAARILATVWVLPVPGPPEMTETGPVSARRAARAAGPCERSRRPVSRANTVASAAATAPPSSANGAGAPVRQFPRHVDLEAPVALQVEAVGVEHQGPEPPAGVVGRDRRIDGDDRRRGERRPPRRRLGEVESVRGTGVVLGRPELGADRAEVEADVAETGPPGRTVPPPAAPRRTPARGPGAARRRPGRPRSDRAPRRRSTVGADPRSARVSHPRVGQRRVPVGTLRLPSVEQRAQPCRAWPGRTPR